MVAIHIELLGQVVVALGAHVEAQLQALVGVETGHLDQILVGGNRRELTLKRCTLDHVANDASFRLLVDGVGVVVVALGVGSIGEVLLIEQGAVAGIVDDVKVELLRNHVARHRVQVRRPGEGDVPLLAIAGVFGARGLERDIEHGNGRGIGRLVVGERGF